MAPAQPQGVRLRRGRQTAAFLGHRGGRGEADDRRTGGEQDRKTNETNSPAVLYKYFLWDAVCSACFVLASWGTRRRSVERKKCVQSACKTGQKTFELVMVGSAMRAHSVGVELPLREPGIRTWVKYQGASLRTDPRRSLPNEARDQSAVALHVCGAFESQQR